MTLIIAVDMGEIGLIASDKAEVMIAPNGDVFPVHQEAEKIIQTPLGVITGAGRVELLDRVKTFVESGEVSNTDQVLNAIVQAREGFRAKYAGDPQVESALLSTSWVFNYTALLENEKTAHRIAMFHASWGEESMQILGTDQAISIGPGNFTAEESAELTRKIRKKVQMPSVDLDIRDALLANVEVAVEAMADVAARSPSVSEICDIAIVGQGLSEIFSDITPSNWATRFEALT